jgi:uncharacterized protein
VLDSNLPTYVRVMLQKGKTSSIVIMVEPHEYDGFTFTEEDIRDIIQNHQAANWYHNHQQISALLTEQRDIKTTKGFTIAEQKDCEIEVRIAPDRMKAWCSVKSAFGGIPLSSELLQNKIGEVQVVYGIQEDAIQQILAQGHADEIMIAEGTLPEPGTDATIEPLIHESEMKGKPHEREDGSVDFFELGLFISVPVGAELMRKYPASPGQPGMGVDGEPIPSTPGKDRSINLGPGTAFSQEDPNLVVSTVAGQPIFAKNSVKIAQKLEVQDVNFKTGNIDFDGTVIIRGTINPGFKIHAGADIIVSDTVEGAELVAQGNIDLKGGFFGKKQGRLEAHGFIRARFLDGCKVHCGGDLEVEDLISNCTISCEGGVYLGKKGGRGQAYGGKISAVKGVTAKLIGSPSEVETHIEVSPSPTLLGRQLELEAEIGRSERNLESLERSLGYLRRQVVRDEARINSFMEACTLTNEKIKEMRYELTEILEKVNTYQEGHIRIGQAFASVTLQYGKRKKIITTLLKDVILGPENTNLPAK